MPLDAVREADTIGALLLRERRVTADALEAARRAAAGKGGRLATVLYGIGAVDLGSLTRALAEVHGMEAIPPERMSSLDPAVVKTLPARVCLRAQAVPVRRSERGLDVAFVDPSDEAAQRDVVKAAGALPVVPTVTAEPLVWYAFRVHGLARRMPPHLEAMVDELVSAGLSSAPKRAPVPAQFEEFHTTPLGGVAPHTPDEVTTATMLDAGPIAGPDEILQSGEHLFTRAEAALDAARGLPEIASAVLAFARSGAAAAAVLRRPGDSFEPVEAAGALERKSFAVPADRPTVLTAALAGETGFRGRVPAGSAGLELFEGRAPKEVLLLPLCRTRGAEALLHVEAGESALDAAFVERLRVLSRRARSALE